MRLSTLPSNLARDVRGAVRALRRSPILTLTCLLTLAICVGANTALFSVVDAVLLRPLPYPHPERLGEVVARSQTQAAEGDDDAQDGQTWFLIHQHATALDAAACSAIPSGINFAAGGRAEFVQQERVGAGFFRVLGIAPFIGREFSADEDRPGGPAVALLSYDFWQRVFGGAPGVVGQTVVLRGKPHVVVGVVPRQLVTTAAADLWTPLQASTTGEGEDENYRVITRLRHGATWAQAAVQLDAIGDTVLKKRRGEDPTLRLTLVPLQRALTEQVRRPLLVLFAAAMILMLIGCANVSSLLLARAVARTRDIATRLALGAGRTAVLRQLLAESLLLALGGGLGGLLLAGWTLGGLTLMAHDSFHLWQRISLDGRVLGAAIGAALFTSLLFGLLPALQMSRTDVREVLSECGRGATDGRRRWSRRLLVITEVALGVVLLVSATLLIRTFTSLRALSPGFDSAHVMTAQVSLQDARYKTSRQVSRLFAESLSRIRALPGVAGAAVGLGLPYERQLRMGFKFLDGPEAKGAGGNTTASYVSPDYRAVLRIPLLRGRFVEDRDGPSRQKVAVVNETFVRRYLPGQDPLGRHIRLAGEPREIVGVIGDVQLRSSSPTSAPIATMPAALIPAAQADDQMLELVHTWFSPSWLVRVAAPPETVAPGIRRAVEAVDHQLPIASFRSMDEIRRRSMAEQRFQAILLSTLAFPALLLAALGIYGLIAHSVVERTREVGIRLALGASRWQTMREVALPGMLLALAGAVLGCALARGAVRSLQHLVWGVRTTDPSTFAAVAGVLLLVSAVASLLPTLRLLRINPAHSLREE
jgi:predicted permease